MLLVVGSAFDPVATGFLESCPPGTAALVDALDLSTPGWCFDPCAPGDARIVAGGEVVGSGEVTGILVRRPAVYPQELVQIDPDDRRYVAAEMTAFLRCWLGLTPVRVFNRPTATCLTGPGWRTVQWQAAARRSGFDALNGSAGVGEVAVVAGEVLGDVSPSERRAVRRLAEEAGVGVLAVSLGGDDAGRTGVVSADPWPDVRRPPFAGALRRALS